MRRTTSIYLAITVIICTSLPSCKWNPWASSDSEKEDGIKVERYDRLQSRYLTTGDFSALQSMNTNYPMETRTLVENVLQLGTVDQQDINERMLRFYQDTTLQNIIVDVESQYANMDDVNDGLTVAFRKLRKSIPNIKTPEFYTQIGALNQSIIIGDGTVGICLDKYLGTEYPIYRRYYYDHQIQTMKRSQIVPDCLLFYLLSLYPMEQLSSSTQESRDAHIGKIMHIVNTTLGEKVFSTPYVKLAERYMHRHPRTSMDSLLRMQWQKKPARKD
ncbi:MAG: gliding motility protein GldB [Prevotella sp.]